MCLVCGTREGGREGGREGEVDGAVGSESESKRATGESGVSGVYALNSTASTILSSANHTSMRRRCRIKAEKRMKRRGEEEGWVDGWVG